MRCSNVNQVIYIFVQFECEIITQLVETIRKTRSVTRNQFHKHPVRQHPKNHYARNINPYRPNPIYRTYNSKPGAKDKRRNVGGEWGKKKKTGNKISELLTPLGPGRSDCRANEF